MGSKPQRREGERGEKERTDDMVVHAHLETAFPVADHYIHETSTSLGLASDLNKDERNRALKNVL